MLKQCRNGDNKAFKELYDRYSKAMFNICMRMLNHSGEAEDALQESFITAFKNLHSYRGEATFGAWLRQIVINRCLDSLRRRNLIFESLDGNDVGDEVYEEENCSYDPVLLREAIAALPDGYRVILSLYLFEEHSHRMIALKLGISEGTSKSQYARSRAKLAAIIRQKIKDHER